MRESLLGPSCLHLHAKHDRAGNFAVALDPAYSVVLHEPKILADYRRTSVRQVENPRQPLARRATLDLHCILQTQEKEHLHNIVDVSREVSAHQVMPFFRSYSGSNLQRRGAYRLAARRGQSLRKGVRDPASSVSPWP